MLSGVAAATAPTEQAEPVVVVAAAVASATSTTEGEQEHFGGGMVAASNMDNSTVVSVSLRGTEHQSSRRRLAINNEDDCPANHRDKAVSIRFKTHVWEHAGTTSKVTFRMQDKNGRSYSAALDGLTPSTVYELYLRRSDQRCLTGKLAERTDGKVDVHVVARNEFGIDDVLQLDYMEVYFRKIVEVEGVQTTVQTMKGATDFRTSW